MRTGKKNAGEHSAHSAVTMDSGLGSKRTHESAHAGLAGSNLRAGSSTGTAAGNSSTAATANLGSSTTGNAGYFQITPDIPTDGAEPPSGQIAAETTDTGDIAGTGPGGRRIAKPLLKEG